VLSNLSEAVSGRELARVMQCTSFFQERHMKYSDEFNRANYAQFTLMDWHGLLTVYLAFTVAMGAAFFVIFNLSDKDDAAKGGLALTYASLLPYFMNMLAMMYMYCKTMFASLERLLEFLDIPNEAPFVKKADKDVAAAWPVHGTISFENMHLRYGPHLSPVLKGINLTLQGGEKVGVVGRTGAGKSSLITALFRLTEMDGVGETAGKIKIDGVDVTSLGLSKLRRAISIIPQDPVLMKATIR